jgi:hypothetical protein
MTVRRNEQLSSRALALAAVGVNLLVCGALTTVLIVVRRDHGPIVAVAAAPEPTEARAESAETTAEYPTTGYPTTSDPTTTTTDPLADYQPVSGPGGMTTIVPASWPSVPAKNPDQLQANDPAGTSRFLRYGGSPVATADVYGSHLEAEADFSATHDGFASLGLERTVVRGMSAVDWEFEYDAPEGRRHVRSVYWLAQGNEYLVYASSPVLIWPDTQKILDQMLENSTP